MTREEILKQLKEHHEKAWHLAVELLNLEDHTKEEGWDEANRIETGLHEVEYSIGYYEERKKVNDQ